MKVPGMGDLFDRLRADPQIGIGEHQGTANLVNELPNILERYLVGPATVKSVMHAQHSVLLNLIERSPSPDWLIDLSETVAEWRNWDTFLECISWTEEDFLMFAYLDDSEISLVKSGSISLGDLLQRKPQAFIAPMLRKIKYIRH